MEYTGNEPLLTTQITPNSSNPNTPKTLTPTSTSTSTSTPIPTPTSTSAPTCQPNTTTTTDTTTTTKTTPTTYVKPDSHTVDLEGVDEVESESEGEEEDEVVVIHSSRTQTPQQQKQQPPLPNIDDEKAPKEEKGPEDPNTIPHTVPTQSIMDVSVENLLNTSQVKFTSNNNKHVSLFSVVDSVPAMWGGINTNFNNWNYASNNSSSTNSMTSTDSTHSMKSHSRSIYNHKRSNLANNKSFYYKRSSFLLKQNNIGSLYEAIDAANAIELSTSEKDLNKKTMPSLALLYIFCIAGALIPVGTYKPNEPFSLGYTFFVVWTAAIAYAHFTMNFQKAFPAVALPLLTSIAVGMGLCCCAGIAVGLITTKYFVPYALLTLITIYTVFILYIVFFIYLYRSKDNAERKRVFNFVKIQNLSYFLILFGYMGFLWAYTNFADNIAVLILAFLFPLFDYILKSIVLYLVHRYHFSVDAYAFMFDFQVAGNAFWMLVLFANSKKVEAVVVLLAGQIALFILQAIQGSNWYFQHLDSRKDTTMDKNSQIMRFTCMNFVTVYFNAISQLIAISLVLLYAVCVRYTHYNRAAYPLIGNLSDNMFDKVLIPCWCVYFAVCCVLPRLSVLYARTRVAKFDNGLDIIKITRKILMPHIWLFTSNAIFGAIIPIMFLLEQNGVAFLTIAAANKH